MVRFKGKEMSKSAFTKYLREDKDLKHVVYSSRSMSQHEAQKFLKKFSEKVGEHEKMDFSMFAKQHNLHNTSQSGEMSGLAAERAYQLTAKEEVARTAPQGPTPVDLMQQKEEDMRKKRRNIANRRLQEMMDNKKGGPVASSLMRKRDPSQPQAQVSAAEPDRNNKPQSDEGNSRSGFAPPPMEHAGSLPQTQTGGTEQQFIQQNNPVPSNENDPTQNPPSPQQKEPLKPVAHEEENEQDERDVNKELPL